MKRVSHKLEAYELTTDELLKRMPKEQAIISISAARLTAPAARRIVFVVFICLPLMLSRHL